MPQKKPRAGIGESTVLRDKSSGGNERDGAQRGRESALAPDPHFTLEEKGQFLLPADPQASQA